MSTQEKPDPAVDPSAGTGDAGEKPVAGEGQEPEEGATTDDSASKADERTYSPSYVKQLRKEAADRREENADLKARLEALEDAEKSEVQKLNEKLETEKAARELAELKNLRTEVGGEHGLPAEALKFLTGQTREEIELHAEELGKLLRQGKPTAGFDGGARQKAPPVPKSPEEEHNNLLLRAIGRLPESRES